jgi:hypothetical protein
MADSQLPEWKELGDKLPQPTNADSDMVWQEVEAFFTWYSRNARTARIKYQTLKVTSLLLAAAVTVLAATDARPVVTACFAAAIVVAEGIQQLFKFHENWLRYRVVTENLREHAFFYVARVAPYDGDVAAAQAKLGALLQTVITDESRQWTAQMKPSHVEVT